LRLLREAAVSGDEVLDFGSLNEVLRNSSAARNLASWDSSLVSADTLGASQNLLRSAGPISDAYMLGTDDVALLNGPGGSGKTIASAKKALISAQRMPPAARLANGDLVRRYPLGVWRQKYDNLWKATIKSWWKVFPRDLPGADWQGASPRSATHTIRFRDKWGLIELIAQFLAFGDVADPEDLRGFEFMDVYLNEIDTLPEELFAYLADRIGRDPPREISKRGGRYYGDCNAPDVTNWVYRDFWEAPKPGFKLYRQPGGRDPGAENPAMGRAYYDQSARINAHRPWWVRRMVDNIPSMTRGEHLVYPAYDDDRMWSLVTLDVEPRLPVLIGVDGGLTPAAVYCQEMNDGQLRILAEIAMERAGMEELGTAMLVLEARRFPDCEFVTDCDPSMLAGEGRDEGPALEKGSDRERLAEKLGRKVTAASTNEPTRRWDAVRDKLALNIGPSRPGLILDPSCRVLHRGFLQTYQYRPVAGTNDLSSVVKTFDSHAHDAMQYAALRCGSEEARKRKTDIARARQARRDASRGKTRYNPLRRRA
jgi:hypothetical protein